MKLLIDTNILIPLEPTDTAYVELATAAATDLIRLASEGGHQLYVHPVQLSDLQRDKDLARRELRRILFNKYISLPDPPVVPHKLEAVLGSPAPYTNDWVDNHLVASLEADAVDFLVTEDRRLQRRADRLQLSNRVASLRESVSILRSLFDMTPAAPPAVRPVVAHALNSDDPIFQSFHEDYPEFVQWLSKAKRQHRQAWIIEVDPPLLAAVCIVKREQALEYGLVGKLLKISTFKVADGYNGFRFGELLLKTLFGYARENRYDWIYVTVFEKHGQLLTLLEDFGFEPLAHRTGLGELVLAKPMSPTCDATPTSDPLAFHVRYGPLAVKIKDVPAFVVPIQPKYHHLLFPEWDPQLDLLAGVNPFGNSLRKAYLSNASTRRIASGATLWFYRSGDTRAVTVLGVAEGTLVSSSPDEIARYVGKRTVYTFGDIRRMCGKPVLAILFRQALLLREPIRLDELIGTHVINGAPQSIVSVSRGATEWLQARAE